MSELDNGGELSGGLQEVTAHTTQRFVPVNIDPGCSYCLRNDADFEDMDGDPICDDCATPES